MSQLPEDPFEEEQYLGPDRRLVTNWDAIELRMRKILEEFKGDLLKELYERSIDPLAKQIAKQQEFCAQHTQELTEINTTVRNIHEAHLVRRVQVMEDRVGLIGKATVVIGTAAAGSIFGLLLLLVTHQIRL